MKNKEPSASDRERLNRLILKLTSVSSGIHIRKGRKGSLSITYHEERLQANLEDDLIHSALFHLKEIIRMREKEILKDHCEND